MAHTVEYQRDWRARNKEKLATYHREWKRRARKDPVFRKIEAERSAQYRKTRPEIAKAAYERWHKEHPERNRAKGSKYKAARLRRTPSWADLAAILSFYEESERLTKETGIAHHVDHVVPLQGKYVSGLHVEYNLQVLPAVENMSKGNRYNEY